MSGIDKTKPKGKWEFDKSVTEVFDDMLERSIPQYDLMRKSVFDIACNYVQNGTTILDLGCAKGDAISPLVDKYKDSNNFFCIDTSDSMLNEAKKRFKEHDNVVIEKIDLRNHFPDIGNSVVLAILTIQFTPIEYRLQILRSIYNSIVKGGCLILVEKVIGDTADIDKLFRGLYYNMKGKNGYSEEDITRKKLSLEGVLVPLTAKWNEQMLQSSGFNQVDCFWRWMNFVGWVAVK
jgi:tRNA (cmo5U34)-methyltransferase|tara:strand:- start:75 stop:779 length:705 start_codon:yes stop_codon:yes gene_type:complete